MFVKLCTITIILTYLLVLVGGIVRSTGAGMGCPDWPKCFGKWVPPVSEEQLPEGYEKELALQREKKNNKVNRVLGYFGINLVSNEASVIEYDAIRFNTTKAWIEYLNRILGVLVGFSILLTTFFAFRYKKENSKVLTYSIGALLLVMLEGYLGSLVVSTNLIPGLISMHMIMALGIIFMLLMAYRNAKGLEAIHQVSTLTKTLLGATIVLSIIQLVLGTQVREAIDAISISLGIAQRDQWIANSGNTVLIHRSFSLIIVVAQLFFYIRFRKKEGQYSILATILLVVIGIEIASGTLMYYLAIPAMLQPVHLLLSFIMLGAQYMLLLNLKTEQQV